MNRFADSMEILDANIGVFDIRNLKRIDFIIVLLIFLLACAGLATLYSASRSTVSDYFVKQALFLCIGTFAASVIVCMDYRFLVSLAPLMYLFVLALLIMVPWLGESAKGGQRWLVLGPLRLQPSELSKFVLVYTLAWYFTRIGERIRKLVYFLLTFVIVGIPGFLILKQPSLGTALSLAPIVFCMLYMAGCKRWHLIGVVVIGLAAAPLAYTQLKDYQKERVLTFIDPSPEDSLEKGWQTMQSKITIGSGGLSGKGYREGTQTYLSYLPEHHTDFIFALLAEEWGFMGSVGLLFLFGFLLLRGLRYARDCTEISGSLIGVGVVSIIGFHVFVNVAITLGLLPVTGMPLPFLSYGGSFYLTTMLCMGTLLSISIPKRYFV